MSEFRFTRPDRFPPVIKNLLIINVLIFIAQTTFGANSHVIENLFALHDVHSVFFKPHQLLTYMFLHGGIDHLLFNMLALWMFGSVLENYWGAKRFLQFYLITGLGAGLLHLGVLYFEMKPAWDYISQFSPEEQASVIYNNNVVVMDKAINAATVGASGAIFGCLAGFGYLFPNTLIYIYFLFPMKAKWFVIIYGAIELALAVRNTAGDNVAHFAHLGGAITGFIIIFIWNKTNRKTLY
ncbi:MAG TPA: rhomboid family intramembrane serine protease [Chitinophagaceae bacterium]|nr:rhomboid family intramembrane serine protease [Chitinophagaceae bacterium]